MDHLNPTDLLALLKNPAFDLLVLWVLKELWSSLRHKNKTVSDDIKSAVIAITELKFSIIKLDLHQEQFTKAIECLPKVRDDLVALHTKVRQLESSSKNQTNQ